MNIQGVSDRKKLDPRREPYWLALGKGRHIGFRRTKNGGTWIARAYDPATRARTYKNLPEAANVAGSEQFSLAAARAKEWFEHLDRGGMPESITVTHACERYVEHLRRKKGDASASDAEARFQRYVYDRPIAKFAVEKLRKRHVENWRREYEALPARPPRRGAKYKNVPPPPPRPKSKSAINRDISPLRAALNLAHSDEFVLSAAAWTKPLAPYEAVDGRREIYLSKPERKTLIASVPEDLAELLKGLCQVPLRPGALAERTVADFDARTGTLRIGTDKGHPRHVPLNEQAIALFKKNARLKTPAAPLLSRANGKAWDKDAWKGPIKSAVKKQGLPPKTVAYSLRHSVITDLLVGGLDVFTVAQLAGTSVMMIQKHYGHLLQAHARKALAILSL